MMEQPTVRAPEIDRPGIHWFNVPSPLSLSALRGKLVILDFWTFCCINCLHVLPTLRRVEEAFPEEVAVIGVHSPKFAAEREPQNVAKAIARYGIVHPVAHDPDRQLWQQYAVRAWPTLVFIGPTGLVLGQVSGEPDPDRLLPAINGLLDQAKQDGLLEPAPLDLDPIEEPSPGKLSFPGKIKPIPGITKRWALADAGHHQIVVFDDHGVELQRFGSGRPGFDDGVGSRASFSDPQGLACSFDTLWVADTGNHALRAIDIPSGRVTTLAGTGRRGPVVEAAPEPALDLALASPWDLAHDPDRGWLYIANAGTHQILTYHLAEAILAAVAGTGAENITDGPALEATLAQPSGLALAAGGQLLFFADSETSAIRALAVEAGQVKTLVGAGLFAFGHENGPLDRARLQHPLGVAVDAAGNLIVADSYNHTLRRIDVSAGTVADVEDGFTCTDPVCLPLAEPAGVWVDGTGSAAADGVTAGRMLVSDTNQHRVMVYDLAKRQTWTWAR